MKFKLLLIALAVSATAHAETWLYETFSGYIPSTFTIVNGNGNDGVWKSCVYRFLGNDISTPWTSGQLNEPNYRSAFALTHNLDADQAADAWMILPSIHVGNPDGVVRWEARSLHKYIPESYSVKVRETGTEEWTDAFSTEGENHQFTMRAFSLAPWAGKDVEIAFVATTLQGFILAIDNIFVGVPTDEAFRFDNYTKRFVGVDEDNCIEGLLTYFGHESTWTELSVWGAGEEQFMPIPKLKCGESVYVKFDISPSLDEQYGYTIGAFSSGGQPVVIASDFMNCSHFERVQVIDRCSGTWCASCPEMELTMTRLENIYRDQLAVIEPHINDPLVNAEYHSDYIGEWVYNIPALIPNHNVGYMTYSLRFNDDFSGKLEMPTVTSIKAVGAYDAQGNVRLKSVVKWAEPTDNSQGNYRVAYILTGDFHDPDNAFYTQSSSASSFISEQLYYQPERIRPEMMFYKNVPVNATVAYHGVPGSLPSQLLPDCEYSHEWTLEKPAAFKGTGLRAIAMVIDDNSGHIMNACPVEIQDYTGVDSIGADVTADGNAEYFDLMGRPVNPSSARGFLVERRGSQIVKTLKR